MTPLDELRNLARCATMGHYADHAAYAAFHRSISLQCRIIGLQARDHHAPITAKAFEMAEWYDQSAKLWERLACETN